MRAIRHTWWFRAAQGVAMTLAALLLCAVLFTSWLLGTSSGAKWLLTTALPYAQANLPENLQIDVQGIEAETLADIRIQSLTIADEEGVWLTVEDVVFIWHPTALWHRQFHAEEISAGKIHLARIPQAEETPPTDWEAQTDELIHALETLPETLQDKTLPPIRIDRFALGELQVNEGILAEPSRFTAKGQLDFTAQPARLAFSMDSLEGVDTHISADMKQEGQIAAFNADWKEAEGGILGSMLQLATPAPVNATVRSQLEGENLVSSANITAGDASLLEAETSIPQDNTPVLRMEALLPKPALLSPLASFSAPIQLNAQLEESRLHLLAQTAQFGEKDAPTATDITAEIDVHLDTSEAPFLVEHTLRATLPQESDEPRIASVVLKAEGDAEEWKLISLNAALGKDITASASGLFNLASGKAQLNGQAEIPAASLSYTLDATDVLSDKPQAELRAALDAWKQPLPAPADTVLAAPITFSAHTESTNNVLPDIVFALKNAAINGEGRFYSNATGTEAQAIAEITVDGLPAALTLSLRHLANMEGNIEALSKNLRLATAYAITSEEVLLNDVALEGGKSVKLNGDIRINTSAATATGGLNGYIRSPVFLNALGVSLPEFSAQTGKTSLQLKAPGGTQHITLRYNAGAVTLDRTALAADVKLNADVQLPAKRPPQINASLKATQVANPVALDQWTVTAKGDTDALNINTSGENETQKTAFSARSTLSLNEGIKLTLSHLQAAWQKNNTLSLAKPATLRYGDALTLSEIDLRINNSGSITAKADLQETRSSAALTIQNVPMYVIPFGALQNTKGMLNGKFNLSGTPNNPAATMRVEISDLQQNYPNTSRLYEQVLTATLNAELRQDVLSAQFSANAPDADSFAAASFTLPVNVTLPPRAFAFTPKGDMDGALRADLVLGPFMPLLMPDGVYGTGHLLADMRIRGSFDSPRISGTASLDSGQIEVLQTGTLISDLTFDLEANGSEIVLRNGKATDADKGTVDFSGTVGLTPSLPMDVKTAFTSFVAMRHTNATATVTGDASLKGDLSDATLKGDWTVNSARITISANGGGSVPEIRVIEVESLDAPLESEAFIDMSEAERKAAREKRRAERPFAQNLKLNISINAENQIFLDGFGLNAELKGAVDISGTADKPKLGGKMETVRGRWEFFGRTFTITRGRAQFSEENLTAPLIDLRAETETDDITAIAQITGTTENPNIDFSSVPSLPKDEILSRVMFGRNLSSISPYQALQLADMLRSLSSGGSSMNPLSKLQNALGIDELKINSDSGDSENVTVGVGKYLQENIYLEVEGGSAEESGKVSVEVDLTPRISVETEARQNAESAVRLNYKYDY
jgi:translocation and assembly module TamB